MSEDATDIELEPILKGDADLVEVCCPDAVPYVDEELAEIPEEDTNNAEDDESDEDSGYRSTLHSASQVLDVEYVKLLLEEGSDVNTLDGRGLTPLDVAGEKIPADLSSPLDSFLELIQTLIAHGGAPTTRPNAKYDETPLHVAVQLDSIKAVHILLNAGYDLPIVDNKGSTALHEAAYQRREEPFKVLLDVLKSSAIDVQNCRGETPLHVAVHSQFLEAVRRLLKNGADIKLKTDRQKNVLHIGATKNHIKIMKELLEHEDSKQIMNERDAGGNAPVFLSILSRQYKSLMLLLKAEVDLTLLDAEERTVLQCATEINQPKMIEALFKNDTRSAIDAIKDYAASDDFTALHIAAFKGCTKCVEILIENGCDLRKKSTYEDREITPLHLATIRGCDEVVKLILNSDPTLVNEPDSRGMMPIHWACIHCHSKVIKIIVDAGCDLSAKCSHPDDGTITTAMDLFINRVPGSVDLVENILDSSIFFKQKSIRIDYGILLPKQFNDKVTRNNQLKVINALVETGDLVNQVSLFVHPVIESFLCLQWERVAHFYYVIIIAYLLCVIPFTIKVTLIFYYNDRTPLDAGMIVLRCLTVLSSIVYVPYQFLYIIFKTRNSRYYGHWECSLPVFTFLLKSVARFCIIGFMFVIFLFILLDPERLLNREVAASAVFIFSIEFMLIISRVPTYGLYMLMFFKVTSNFVYVLLSFTFLIAGFVVIFLIEFQGNPPFSSAWDTIIKTVVMMTNEWEYKDMFENLKLSGVTLSFSKIVFVMFLLLVGLVTMNILLAKAILDVEKVDRLRKQAEFLSIYEQILVLFPIPMQEIGPKQRIYFDKAQPFPRKLMNSIFMKAYKVKKDKLCDEGGSKQDDKLFKLLTKFEHKINLLSNKIEQLNKIVHSKGNHSRGENRGKTRETKTS